MLAHAPLTETDSGTPDGGVFCRVLPAIGVTVGERYRIIRLIGEGGMGTVFEAEVLNVGKRCAIKFLRAPRASRSHSNLRFEREARLLARLEHDHLTAVLDYGQFQGGHFQGGHAQKGHFQGAHFPDGHLPESTPYYVMEYVAGETLRQRLLRDGALGVEVAVDLMQQVCRGMAHAHEHGVVHRDLKPDNLMLTRRSDGQPWIKILDFGVARWTGDEAVPATPTGAELGTAHYMSPEQARGSRDVNAASDVYALGAILYEMIAGRRLHGGSSYNEVLFQLLTRTHEPLRQAAPDCPAALAQVVERCLQREVSERYANGQELLNALLAVELRTAPPVTASPATASLTTASLTTLERPDPSASAERSGNAFFRLASVFIAGGLLGGAVTLAVLQRRPLPDSASGSAASAGQRAPSPESARAALNAAPVSAPPNSPPRSTPPKPTPTTPPASAAAVPAVAVSAVAVSAAAVPAEAVPAAAVTSTPAPSRARRASKLPARRSNNPPVAKSEPEFPFLTRNPYAGE